MLPCSTAARRFSANNNWLYFRIKPLNSDKRLARTYPMIIAQQMAARSTTTNGRRSIVALDENWDMLDSPHMAPQVEQSFRIARTNNASIWGISQAIEDYTGFPEILGRPVPAFYSRSPSSGSASRRGTVLR